MAGIQCHRKKETPLVSFLHTQQEVQDILDCFENVADNSDPIMRISLKVTFRPFLLKNRKMIMYMCQLSLWIKV